MFTFSAPGFVLGAALAQNLPANRASEIELLGGMFGSTPFGLVLVATLAQQAAGGGQPPPSGPGSVQSAQMAQVPDLTTVPDDVNTPQLLVDWAKGLLGSLQLSFAGTTPVLSAQPVGTPLSSTPPAGTFVSFGTGVTLQISAGLEPEVPDVTNQSLSDAQTELEGAGFESVVVSGSKAPTSTVTSQSPPAGPADPATTTVQLVVSDPLHQVTPLASTSRNRPRKAAPKSRGRTPSSATVRKRR